MEKITFKNSRNLNINGLFHPVDSDSVIILCHGLGGDNSEWGRFEPTATKFNEAGYNVLRFDFGGCGDRPNRFCNCAWRVCNGDAGTCQNQFNDWQYPPKHYEPPNGNRPCGRCFPWILHRFLWRRDAGDDWRQPT